MPKASVLLPAFLITLGPACLSQADPAGPDRQTGPKFMAGLRGTEVRPGHPLLRAIREEHMGRLIQFDLDDPRGSAFRNSPVPVQESTRLPTVRVEVAGREVVAEVAAEPSSRRQGLMGRSRLPPDHGMLFVWPEEGRRWFWMKGTRIPLSVAFLSEAGRILNIEPMRPMRREPRYSSRGPARFALEMPRGWFRARGIGPGDRCRFRLPAELAPRGRPLKVDGVP